MRTISERDARSVLSIVGGLSELESAEEFPPSLLKELAELVGASRSLYVELDRRNEVPGLHCGWFEGEEFVARPADSDTDSPYWRLRDSHPCCSYRERADAWTDARTVSDFASVRQFKQTPIWNEYYREAKINYWLDVGLTPRHGRTRVFIFTHERRDFSGRSKLVLELLVPHLERRAAAVSTARAAADALCALEEESNGDAREIVVTSPAGAIEYATPRFPFAAVALLRPQRPATGRVAGAATRPLGHQRTIGRPSTDRAGRPCRRHAGAAPCGSRRADRPAQQAAA